MAYKSIAVVVTDAAQDAAALRAAAAIAESEDAHLDVFCLGIDPSRYDALAMGTAPVVLETGLAEARERANTLAAWARGALPAGMIRAVVQPVAAAQIGLDIAVSRLGRYSDLVVAAKPYGKGRDSTHVAIVESALFATGAPVLIVPDDATVASPFARVVVAWDESDVSLEAVRDALPVLQAAGHVDVVMVDPPSHSPERSDPGGAVTLMLARHGVRAEVSILARTMPRVSDVIARFAQDHGADAIVMGAYGHSRFREAILGGATREMLEQAALPLFMSH